MYKIYGEELKSLQPLCRKDDYISSSVIKGLCKGYALVDNKETPKRAMLFQSYSGFLNYMGDKPLENMLDQLTQEIVNYRSERDFVSWVEFSNYPEDIVQLLEDKIDDIDKIERIYWEHSKKLFDNTPVPQLSEEFTVSLIAKEDLENIGVTNDILLFWDNAEEMLDKTIGTKIKKGDKIIGVCTPAAYVNGYNEIDISINKEYRRKGLGYAMAHTFIQECYKRGEKPAWDCVSHNEPSKALATKLGFKPVGSYKLLEW